MINERLIKSIVLVTVMQSLLLVGIEIASYYKEQRYIEEIEKVYERDQLFTFKEEDFEEFDYHPLDFSNVPHSCVPHAVVDHTPIEKLNSKNVITIAKNRTETDNGNVRTV